MEQKAKILIVDDVEINREILKSILSDDYEIIEASNGREALEIVQKNFYLIDIILLDIIMPDIDGFYVLETLKLKNFVPRISVILITSEDDQDTESKGLKMGAADFIAKPFKPHAIKARVDTQLELKRYKDGLLDLVAYSEKKLDSVWDHVLNTLANVIEYRNIESGEHVKRTSIATTMLINKMCSTPSYKLDIPEEDISTIIKASALHDIGKIAISDNILLKPGRLTEDEFNEIKRHTILGEKIAESFLIQGNVKYVKYCKEVCRWHHEKWNGKGYPDQLSGFEIPLSARVVAIVDVFDALVSERVYKKAFSFDEALEIIRKDSGTHFDPEIATLFIEIKDEVIHLYTQLGRE